MKLEERLAKYDFNVNIKDITGSRASVINGLYDFTEYGMDILNDAPGFSKYACKFWQTDGEILAKVVVAECQYQKNECYKSLIQVSSALAFLEESGNAELWFVARYIQMCIMIVTGQLETIHPLVDGMKNRIYASENQTFIANYEALSVWCALYDNDKSVVDAWMKNGAPNEFATITLEDTFRLFIKARVYLEQGKNLALIALLEAVKPILEENQKKMQLCEMYMLYALALYSEGKSEDAYVPLEQALTLAMHYQFDRLLADEGRKMYDLLSSYIKEFEKQEDTNVKLISYAKDIRNISRDILMIYPQYLQHDNVYARLTPKEHEVLVLIAEQYSNIEIAEKLDISINTVKYHTKNIFRKLETKNRRNAVKKAIERKYI